MSENEDHHHHDNELDPMAARVKALETILTEKGLIDPAAIDAIVETYETRVGPRNGARVVARAWSEPDFAEWLKTDATAAIASLGYTGRQGEHMQAVFNSPERHNLVVCTLCSCYPWSVLGLPPVWYKAPAYRSRPAKDDLARAAGMLFGRFWSASQAASKIRCRAAAIWMSMSASMNPTPSCSPRPPISLPITSAEGTTS